MILNKQITFLLVILGLLSFGDIVPMSGQVLAEETSERKTRKTPALREKVYSQLARAQKMADEGQVEEGLEILEEMKGHQQHMNSYERAMLWNFLAFIYYNQEKIPEAVKAFDQVIAQENIPESLEMSTLFSLAQLSMSVEKYQDTLKYLDQWETLATEKTNRSSAWSLRANAYYATSQYKKALEAVDAALASVQPGEVPKENLLVLKRALHYELKQTAKVASVTEQLLRLYDKPKYWVELANLYGELGDEDKHLAIMEAAYLQGYIEKSADFQTLAQLYYYAGAPFKAAELLSKAIDNKQISPDLKIYTFLAQCWEAAKETNNAIDVLKVASGLTNDHEIYQRLARLHIDLEKWQQALKFAQKAEDVIEHVKVPGNVYVAQGIALLNMKRFDESIKVFKMAREISETNKVASQWLRYAEKESELEQALKNSADVGAQ